MPDRDRGHDSDRTILDKMPSPVKRGIPWWVWAAAGVILVGFIAYTVFG
jgi:hypothetical protein